MKTVLFASAAAVSLALAGAAFAQTTQPVSPTPPPVQTPAETPDATVEGQVGTTVQATPPQAQTDPTISGEAQAQTATPTPPDAAAPPTAATQGQADATAAPTVPPTEAAGNAAAMATSPASPAASQADAAAVATPATTASVCEPRVTSVHFGARGAALSQQNRNAIEYAVDAASVCTLQSVVIADSAEGRLSARRAGAVRAALVRQGVPRDRITVESAANGEGAGTGQLDVRMNFAGVASAEATPAATNEAEPAPTPPAS